MVNAYFLDSSALVKRYIPETGSAWIQAIADTATGNLLFITRITWVEVLIIIPKTFIHSSNSADKYSNVNSQNSSL
ncbi:type II toxin-antitoxin system VapC family toxin [Coleofasciculus sp. E1-EBD-02]|uniref:type II toxin-antitoxin system VapC family toxin n=1 Tax=Coleofasciculus sp. E1-EBD-02 TaxID=3068481 RepID=UPI0032FF21F3